MRDLERPHSEGAITQQTSEERLLQLEGVDRTQVHGGGTAACDVSVEDEDFLSRDREHRAVPEPNCPQGDQRAAREQDRSEHGERRCECKEHGADPREGEGPR
jgi:hypothetical protein